MRPLQPAVAALAVVLDRGDQVELLPQGSVPYGTTRASWATL
jgi:hypothetical protein